MQTAHSPEVAKSPKLSKEAVVWNSCGARVGRLLALPRLLRSFFILSLTGLSACQEPSSGTQEAIFLVEQVRSSPATFDPAQLPSLREEGYVAASITLDSETRVCLVPTFGSPLGFDVEIPSDPVLRFAVAVATPDASRFNGPVGFRISVETEAGKEDIFSENIGPLRANQWIDQAVPLTHWAGEFVRLTFQANPLSEDEPRPSFPEDVFPLWGNPVVASSVQNSERPNLILISVDALRADHVGAYGYTRGTTPRIDEFAADGVVFETAIATSSTTIPTHVSMLTGLPATFHGASPLEKLSRSVVYLPEMLASAGYLVDGVVSGPYLSQDYGFERGFHLYRDLFPPAFFETRHGNRFAAAKTIETALDLVRHAQGLDHFLFLHVIDPHWPYYPPSEFLEKFSSSMVNVPYLLQKVRQRHPPKDLSEVWSLIDLYDADIAYADQMIGRFLDELKAMGLYEHSLIILTADHGEAFYEHGHWEHSDSLYEEIIHVPLIVKWPGSSPKGRVQTMVHQPDIFATLLAEARITSPLTEAVSLHRYLSDPDAGSGSRPAVSEILWRSGMRKVSIRTEKVKYIASFSTRAEDALEIDEIVTEELYNLVDDPGERRNLLEDGSSNAGLHRKRLFQYLEEAREFRKGRQGTQAAPSESTLERLRSLGYIQ